MNARDAKRARRAKSLGWTAVDYDPAGKLVGKPPRPSWPGDYQPVPLMRDMPKAARRKAAR